MSNEQQQKRDKLTQYLYILPAFGTSAGMAFFSSYLAMLLTDIYMLPVMLAGILEAVRSVLGWVAAPIFGLVLDRVTFKSGKYWQWIVIGVVVANVANAVTFILPSLSEAPETLAFVIFLLGIAMALFSSVSAAALQTIYPKLSTDPQTRSMLAVGQKIGRDGGKTMWGLIVPALLIYFTAKGGSDPAGWASTAYIIAGFAIVVNVLYAFILRGSSLEKEAIAEKEAPQKAQKPKVPLSVVFKTLFTNKPLFSMFAGFTIHKIYYFFQILTGAYYFNYVANDFGKLGLFMTAFNLSAVVGSIFGGSIWIKIFKDSKRAFVAGGFTHVLFLLVLTLFSRSMSTMTFIFFVGCASFFAGSIEAFLMPMFAAASDYQAWKTGERSDGLTMAVYGLTVRVATTISALVRSALLAWAGYDAAAYAQGAAPSESVIGMLTNFQSLYPMVMGIVAFGLIQLFYPLTDKKVAKIHEEIEAGRVGELRDEAAVNAA